jgi:serine phosphatase RsbU (regulator of sigma subunit)/tetratricopeptide (TPR) repeat protein
VNPGFSQGKKAIRKYSAADTALIRLYIKKGTGFASNNNDSAMYFADEAIDASQQTKNETLLANAFYLKAKTYYFMSSYSAAQFYQYKSLVLSEKLGEKDLQSRAYNLGGAIFFSLGNFDEAIKNYNNRVRISSMLKDTSSVIQTYFNIALVYNTKGAHGQAAEVTYKALDIAEKRRDTMNMMALYESLGMSYNQLHDLTKATTFLNKAYKLALLKNEEYEQGGILIDLGNVYQQSDDYYTSIQYYNDAIGITRKNGDKRRLSTATSNKAKSLLMMKRYKEAMLFNEEAMKLALEINYAKGLVDGFATKAECLFATEKYKEAEESALKAVEIAEKIQANKEAYDCYLLLNTIYDKLNDTPKAYKYYKHSIELRDSIEDPGQVKAIAELGFGYEKAKTERLQKFKEEQAAADLKKQKQIRNIFLAGGIVMFVLLVFIIRVYVQTRRANNEITKQNKIIEETNTRILESIDYSKNIQQSILMPEADIKKLLPGSFVLYKPKDIVSGDFYFIEPILRAKTKWMAVALADCTGHGVPGALMSLMGYNILRQSLEEEHVTNPGEALDYLNKELHSFLRQNQKEKHILDGMDIAFVAIEHETRGIIYSGANNPLWIASKNKTLVDENGKAFEIIGQSGENNLYEIRATKQPIGFSENPKQFVNHKFKLEQGDMLYLFTDGFADQFGGPKGKKYKYRQLAETILANTDKTPEEQGSVLENSFSRWKGRLEQVDDVSVIGIRI